MKDYLSKWTIPRIIQLAIGIMFFSSYVAENNYFALIFGSLMFFQAVLNIGCFSSKGCGTNPSEDSGTTESLNLDDIEFETIG